MREGGDEGELRDRLGMDYLVSGEVWGGVNLYGFLTVSRIIASDSLES